MSLYDIAHDLDTDAEVLVHEDVAKPAYLRPGNVGMGIRDRSGQMIRCLPDDLEIAFNRILGHLYQAVITIETAQVAEREATAIAHRLRCPAHEFAPETHPSCVSGDQDTADSRDREGLRTDSDLAVRPSHVANDAAFDPRHDVDIM
jgi:hypothetical protein